MSEHVPRIVVVGGGLSGLTTAYRLLTEAQDDGRRIDVTVLESRPRVGGMAVAFKMDGLTVEHGSHGLFGSGVGYYVNSVRLTKDLGTYANLYHVPGWTLVDRDGRRALITNTPGLPRLVDVLPSILRIPWFGLGDKLRACRAALRLARIRHADYGKLDALNGYQVARRAGYSHDGAMTWNMASLGLTNQFIDGDPARGDPGLSGALFAGKHGVLLGAKKGLSYLLPDGDLSDVFAEPLRARIQALGGRVRTDAKVESVDPKTGAVEYRSAGGRVLVPSDHTILALQPWAAAKLVTWVRRPWMDLKPTSPVITMTLVLSGRVHASKDGRELGLSRKAWPFSVITDLSRFWPEFAPERIGDKTVFRVEIGHADLPPGEASILDLVHEVKAGLDKLFPECAALHVENCQMNHERELLYVSWLRGEWVKKPTAADRHVAESVYLAGDWTSKGTIGLEAAVNSGYEAVNWIHRRLGLAEIAFPDVPID